MMGADTEREREIERERERERGGGTEREGGVAVMVNGECIKTGLDNPVVWPGGPEIGEITFMGVRFNLVGGELIHLHLAQGTPLQCSPLRQLAQPPRCPQRSLPPCRDTHAHTHTDRHRHTHSVVNTHPPVSHLVLGPCACSPRSHMHHTRIGVRQQ
jgi:hypothetical protein